MASPLPEILLLPNHNVELAEGQPDSMEPLANHLAESIRAKSAHLESQGKTIGVLDPDWSRANPEEAGRLHADVIVGTYGDTYALPNKDPEANRQAIESGELDVYFMTVDNKVTGTACLVNTGDGRAELGRSASIGRSGNSIIQDLRILDWLTNPETAAKYHTLFTTLRSAPDRLIDTADGDFVMRGGQAITEHWRKFPGLVVNGFAPLYLKHGSLEQFTQASITRRELDPTRPLYLADSKDAEFVKAWHDHYELPHPQHGVDSEFVAAPSFEAHYPPPETGLTGLVHADIKIGANGHSKSLEDCLSETEGAGSPFTQIVIPLDRDTRKLQVVLRERGFQAFGYEPASEGVAPALLYGKVTPGIEVVPTHWTHHQTPNPFWEHDHLQTVAESVAGRW